VDNWVPVDNPFVIRILLADDQALVRGALSAMLNLESDIEVVAEVGSGDEVLDAALRTTPDVALLDVQMPGKDGLVAAAELRGRLPSCKVIVCTTFGRPGYLSRAMAAGAVGFVVKDSPPEQLVDAVRRVAAGLRVVDPALAAESLASGPSPLTEREREVLAAASVGGTIADVAKQLHLSQGTVRNHLSAAIGKTGARTRAEAARLAEDRGWL
jgi:two-component system response regulator DesR